MREVSSISGKDMNETFINLPTINKLNTTERTSSNALQAIDVLDDDDIMCNSMPIFNVKYLPF